MLAAGESRRYGAPKLLETYRGETLVHRATRTLIEAGCVPVIAVLPPEPAFDAALLDLAAARIVNEHPEAGIARSIALGVGALPADAVAALIAVADQPLLTPETVRRLLESFRPGAIIAVRYGEVVGNPRIFDRRYFDDLLRLRGDRGAQLLAARHPEAVSEVAVDPRSGLDIDVPDDWVRLGEER